MAMKIESEQILDGTFAGVLFDKQTAIKTRFEFMRARKAILGDGLAEFDKISKNMNKKQKKAAIEHFEDLDRIKNMANAFYKDNFDKILKNFSNGNFKAPFIVNYENFDYKIDNSFFKALLNEMFGKIGLDFNVGSSEYASNKLLVTVSPSEKIFDKLDKIICQDMLEFRLKVKEALEEENSPLLNTNIKMLFFENGDFDKPKSNISQRVYNALKISGFIDNIGDLKKCTPNDLLKLRGIDKKGLAYIKEELGNIRQSLEENEPYIRANSRIWK